MFCVNFATTDVLWGKGINFVFPDKAIKKFSKESYKYFRKNPVWWDELGEDEPDWVEENGEKRKGICACAIYFDERDNPTVWGDWVIKFLTGGLSQFQNGTLTARAGDKVSYNGYEFDGKFTEKIMKNWELEYPMNNL